MLDFADQSKSAVDVISQFIENKFSIDVRTVKFEDAFHVENHDIYLYVISLFVDKQFVPHPTKIKISINPEYSMSMENIRCAVRTVFDNGIRDVIDPNGFILIPKDKYYETIEVPICGPKIGNYMDRPIYDYIIVFGAKYDFYGVQCKNVNEKFFINCELDERDNVIKTFYKLDEQFL